MSLKHQLTDDMKAAMKAGEKERLGVIRLINAAIKQKEVDERIELDDAQVAAVLDKMVKQRRDSIHQYDAAGREDLAGIERNEIAVIEHYLPAKMSEAEIVSTSSTPRSQQRRHRSGRHGQADGRAQAAPGRQGRHGRGLGDRQAPPRRRLSQ